MISFIHVRGRTFIVPAITAPSAMKEKSMLRFPVNAMDPCVYRMESPSTPKALFCTGKKSAQLSTRRKRIFERPLLPEVRTATPSFLVMPVSLILPKKSPSSLLETETPPVSLSVRKKSIGRASKSSSSLSPLIYSWTRSGTAPALSTARNQSTWLAGSVR